MITITRDKMFETYNRPLIYRVSSLIEYFLKGIIVTS